MTNTTGLCIKRGASLADDEFTAARELAQAIRQENMALAIFYCASRFDLTKLAAALRLEFQDSVLIGCTTAGEIAADGYHNGSITGVSIAGSALRAVSGRIDLTTFHSDTAVAFVDTLSTQLAARGQPVSTINTFGFLLIDGLSMQEELVASTLHQSLHGVQMFGGSAGDDVRFERTFIYHEGRFHTNIALLTLLQTELPFHVFRSQHFVASDCKMVVTAADPARRIVYEINGEPAGTEFARAVGLNVMQLTPLIFAAHPVVVRVGGDYYVRSIQKVNDDGSLSFFCAIDAGLVLTVARGKDMIENLDKTFAAVRERIGTPQLILGCDCILRRLELEQRGIKEHAAALFAANNVVGFATYGEQFNAMHVNQTFTGVAIGNADHD